MDLLKRLCEIHAPSGEEIYMKEFLLEYIKNESPKWKVNPQIIHGEAFQDSLMLVFGKPRTAVFAHMDSIGFTVRYHNQLVPIGGPHVENGYKLVGKDSLGPIECELVVVDDQVNYKFGRAIQRGTSLTFSCYFRDTKDYVQSCYLDNRLGVYNAIKLAETLEDGIIVFSCWEEHGGGSVPYLAKYIYENYKVKQALISDITWITEGVIHGNGVVISMRDKNIPRRSFIDKIITICESADVDFQLEVEGYGSSDGRELQVSPYPFDWCFIGAPEDNVHSPDEIVHKHDINCMLKAYRVLMEKL
ncbi:MAG: aminopeptidase [Bacteroidota bacterium]|nr:aminopeptidase [Bacteroidota bacterium]